MVLTSYGAINVTRGSGHGNKVKAGDWKMIVTRIVTNLYRELDKMASYKPNLNTNSVTISYGSWLVFLLNTQNEF